MFTVAIVLGIWELVRPEAGGEGAGVRCADQ
jgi:hypothetical protein